MKKLIFMAALMVAGCAGEAEKAEQEYRIASSTFLTPDERCAAERKIERAHLSDGNSEKHQSWRTKAAITCNGAEIERLMRQ